MTSSFFEGDQLFLSAIAPKGSDFGSGPLAEWGSVVLVFDTTSSALVSASEVGPATGKVYGFAHSAGRSVLVGGIPSGPGFGDDASGFVFVN